jgi:heptose-I-phosphate ethanolaminephosphotransferase
LDSLLIFRNVISSATQTRESIIRILTTANIENEKAFFNTGSIITLARDLGYKTYWISNQMMYGISDTETTVLAKDCDKQWFINTDWNTNSLDENILPVFNDLLNKKDKKKFIVLHLLGNHFSYNKRYKHNGKFDINDDFVFPAFLSKHQTNTINEYDRSVKYNDSIVYTIIKNTLNKKGIVNIIYLSDHGEDVYDTPKLMLGHGSPRITKYVIEVPFLMYNNTEFYNKDKRTYKYFKEIKKRPFCTVDLFYTIADIMWADFKENDLSRSLVSEDFIERKRKVISSDNRIILYEDILQDN